MKICKKIQSLYHIEGILEDTKLIIMGCTLYIFIVSFASSFHGIGVVVCEQLFNFLKVGLGIYTAHCWLKKWNYFKSTIRTAFLAFDVVIPCLTFYNIYWTFVHPIGNRYIFTFSYHLVTITLFLGQIALLRGYQDGRRTQKNVSIH